MSFWVAGAPPICAKVRETMPGGQSVDSLHVSRIAPRRILDSLGASTGAGEAWVLLKAACSAWREDNVPRLGAALAFYTIFSLTPVLIVVIAVVGAVFGRAAAEGEILRQIQAFVGRNGAAAIQTVIQSANRPGFGTLASAISFVTVLIGASGAFVELQDALNTIWRVKPRSEKFWVCALRKRCSSFGLVLATGFLLLVSLALSAALTAMWTLMGRMLPTAAFWLFESINFLLSAAVTTLLFALIYKFLPDTEIAWSDVWIGAGVTSLFFTLGKTLIGLYLGRSTMASPYGAAASLVIVLVWAYYSAQILLLGAEFTHVYAIKHGSKLGTIPPRMGRSSPVAAARTALARVRSSVSAPRDQALEKNE